MADLTYNHPASLSGFYAPGAKVSISNIQRLQNEAAKIDPRFASNDPFAVKSVTKGLRDDKSKLGIHLLPVGALEEVAKVFDYGKRKYTSDTYDATDNWRKGLSWRSTTGSLLRHAFSFLRGEDRDPESGLYHAAHVAANALFLLQFLIEGGGTDDRYKEANNKA